MLINLAAKPSFLSVSYFSKIRLCVSRALPSIRMSKVHQQLRPTVTFFLPKTQEYVLIDKEMSKGCLSVVRYQLCFKT